MTGRSRKSATRTTGEDRSFRPIGQAAEELGLKPHVLRYWETRFEQIRPMKRPDGRRYYRPEDMDMLRRLQDLLHVRGLSLREAARVFSEETLQGARTQDGEQSKALVAAAVVPDGAENLSEVAVEDARAAREPTEAAPERRRDEDASEPTLVWQALRDALAAEPKRPPPGASPVMAAVRLGRSVVELQAMVREAVGRGDFGEAILAENEAARERLETLLGRLTRLKGRVDDARAPEAA